MLLKRRKLSMSTLLVQRPNPARSLAPSGRWTLRDKAAQRRLARR